MSEANTDQIKIKTKLYYGIGALGKDYAVSIIYIFLMFYYTDIAGLPAAFVGTLFFFARIIDAFTDPMMGMVVDNTKSRFGKFRPWIVIGALINSVFLVAVFATHLFQGTALYVYAAFTYILWGVSYTIMDIPFWSMIPALSKNRAEREKLVVWPRIFASFAWMSVGTYGLWVVGLLGGDDKGQGFLTLSIVIVVFFIFSSILTAVNVKERVQPSNVAVKFTGKDVLNIIMSNDQLKALFGLVLSFNIAIQLIGGFAIYYFSYAIGNADLFPMFMLVSGMAEIAGTFLFPRLSNILPRRLMWFLACGFPIICCFVLFITGLVAPENAILTGIAGAALKFGGGLANGLSTVMLADVVDYGEHKTGRRSESIIFSVQTMMVKGAGAFAGFFIGVGLSIVGYVPNVVQTDDTIAGIQILMLVVPAILMLISAAIYRAFYTLHEGFHVEHDKLDTATFEQSI
jgi:melibiose permease